MSSEKKVEKKVKKKITFNETNIKSQKECTPGPNVKFPKGEVPFPQYLIHNKIPGSLGCTKTTYPKYRNGKYCCESIQASDQETFDYINTLLENILKNVTDSQKKKQEKSFRLLLSYRDKYKEKKDPILEDHFDIPPEFLLDPRVFVQWDEPVRDTSIVVTNNAPSSKPKSIKTRSRTPSKSSGGKTRKKK